ncbi:MAG: hypothetical protein ABH854_01095 [Candidatus Diapherotrites archaeon]
MDASDFAITGGLVDPRLKKALQFKRLDHYIFTHDLNYRNQMTILRNAMVTGIVSWTEGMEMKVQAMTDAYVRIEFLSKKTAEKSLWAEWKEFGKMKDEIDEIFRKRERKWNKLEHKIGFGKAKAEH